MIKTLTEEQKAKLPEFTEKYRWITRDYQNNNEIREVINEIWESWGNKMPKIIYARNPMEAVLFSKILENGNQLHSELGSKLRSLLDRQLRRQLHSELSSKLRSLLDRQLDRQLGSELRRQLRRQLDRQLSSELGRQLHRQLGSQLRSQLGTRLGDELDSELYSQLNSQLDSKLYRQLNSQLGSELYSELCSELDSKLDSQLDSQLRSQLGESTPGYTSTYWLFWVCYYKFAEFIGVEFNNKKLATFEKFLTNIQFCIPYKDLVIVSRKPKNYFFENQVLHNDEGPAYQFDGWELYYLHGVHVTKEQHKKITSRQLTFKEASEFENIELRQLAFKYMGATPLLEGAGAELIHEGIVRDVEINQTNWDNVKQDDDFIDIKSFLSSTTPKKVKIQNKLYLINNNRIFGKPWKVLYYTDPSTGREYISYPGANYEDNMSLTDADEAMATKRGVTKQEYLNLQFES